MHDGVVVHDVVRSCGLTLAEERRRFEQSIWCVGSYRLAVIVLGFKSTRLKRLESALEFAEREFSKLVERGSGDASTEFGADFAAWVEVTWLNLSDETAPLLARTSATWVNAWREQNREEATFHSNKLYDIARALFKDRRDVLRDPEQDPASSLLLEKGPDGEPLTDELLV